MKKYIKVLMVSFIFINLFACSTRQSNDLSLPEQIFNASQLEIYKKYENQVPTKLAYFEANKGQVEITDSDFIKNAYTTLLGMKIGDKVDDAIYESEREFIFIFENGETISFQISKSNDTYTVYNSNDGLEYAIDDDNGMLDIVIDMNQAISFEQACKTLELFDEVQDNLKIGMSFLDGGIETIDNRKTRIVNMGSNSEDKFTIEKIYAVFINGDVDYYDVLTDAWINISTAG